MIEVQHFLRFGAVATLIAVTGCSNLYEGKYDFREGWTTAEILRIEPLSQLRRPDFYTCIRKIPPADRGEQRIAVLDYKRAGSRAMYAVPIAADDPWQVGQRVYLNVTRCEGAIAPRSAAP